MPRRLAIAAVLVTTASATGAQAAQAQNGYHINTAGANLTVRSGPGTGYSATGSIADGHPVDISCQAYGSTVSGTYGTSNVWDKIGAGRYVADSYVYTGHDGKFLSTCATSSGTLKDEYPYKGQTSRLDRWNFIKVQCTAFVAWRINERLHIGFNNYYRGPHWGNASNWDNAARSLNIPVNHTPSVGAVVQWNSGTYGHVAWVTRVNSGGTVTIEEYNYLHRTAYDYRTISASSVENYIHF